MNADYRVVRHAVGKELWYDVHRVQVDGNDVMSEAQEGLDLCCESIDELRDLNKAITEALAKPIVDWS